MRLWRPDPNAEVGPKEPLGRRFFDQPELIGAIGQKTKPSLDYRNFEDDRDQLSLDRLGRTSPEGRVLNYLAPRARAAGAKRLPPLEFNGWYYIKKEKLVESKKLQIVVVASPDAEREGAELEGNVYHSHLEVKHAFPDDASYWIALHLKTLFERHGDPLAAPPNQPEDGAPVEDRAG